MEREKLIQEIAKHNWMHTIDLGQGVVTPGRWPTNEYVMRAYDSIDFEGKKVLDIGACNGLWSFEAERRGAAEVYSVDYLTHVDYWCTPAYKLAHEALQSKARYFPDLDVYDVEKLGVKDFDIVVFSGVYYHLKHPLLALTKLRRVMKNGGRIIIEGPIFPDDEHCYSTFHYRDVLLNDKSNWCVPTRRCLREWIECSFFDVEQVFEKAGDAKGIWSSFKTHVRSAIGSPQPTAMRTVMLARAVTRHDELYSTLDPELAEYFE
jgi:tRNA (mo5U34)-methyltransferase